MRTKRIRRIWGNRRFRALFVALAALWLAFWGAGQANATIYWYGVSLQNVHESDACLRDNTPADTDPILSMYCYGNTNWDLVSYASDSNGHAEVLIRNDATNKCVTASANAGPLGPHSRELVIRDCGNDSDFYANQIWQMTTAAPTVNGWHQITFWDPFSGTCLDGGIGVYGFPGQCDPGNDYQVWDVYHP